MKRLKIEKERRYGTNISLILLYTEVPISLFYEFYLLAPLSLSMGGMYLIECTYNFCWIHQQLDQTPATTVGLTDHALSVKEVLTYKVPLHLLAKTKEDELRETGNPSYCSTLVSLFFGSRKRWLV